MNKEDVIRDGAEEHSTIGSFPIRSLGVLHNILVEQYFPPLLEDLFPLAKWKPYLATSTELSKFYEDAEHMYAYSNAHFTPYHR